MRGTEAAPLGPILFHTVVLVVFAGIGALVVVGFLVAVGATVGSLIEKIR